jgi:hypothetical protein
MTQDKLTEQYYWDDYWENLSLPSEIKKTRGNYYLNEILKVFDKYFPQDPAFQYLK